MVKGPSKPAAVASTLGARIRAVRKAWGWTQADLASALGNDQQIVSYWERDKAKPTRTALLTLARTFRLSTSALATGDGFTIPDLPSSGAAQRLDALRCAVHGLQADVDAGSIQVVEAGQQSPQAMTARQAKAFLDRAHKDGLTVWVIASQGPC